ncbi:hypothetical protein HH214_07685 [Mucilaginibacter robiniae]|uniref:Uncharacterized protein n=1 Tax=Mucilaginibacter robiniae TaxID=2728022 RepID=A0A7L5DZV4_9SPHI|nr:hypothetical protein [Mucilaginibacter robiniae]QJD95758.1 hypothetical protein HH214_07685 [Mucilaginibacter robiniae]
MWKKWLHIVLSLWLINAITYFHASNPFDHTDETNGSDAVSSCLAINTWADCILQFVANDDGVSAQKTHKIKFQRRYIHTRVNSVSVFLAIPILYLLFAFIKRPVKKQPNHYSIGVALLPAYYNFLFRLSPF